MAVRNTFGRFLLLAVACLPLPAAAQSPDDAAAHWAALTSPRFDTNRVAAVERVELKRDAATVTLSTGQLALGPVLTGTDGIQRTFFAAFRGGGRLRLVPTLPLEKQQLAFHSGQETLETEFTEAVFVFTDGSADELTGQVRLTAGDAANFQKLFDDRSERWRRYGLNWEPRLLKALLAADPGRHALFVAELKTSSHGWLTLVVDASDPEQVELQQFDPGRFSLDVWTKFPAGGRTPHEAFSDPVAHHEYRLKGYRLDVTVEGNADLSGQADVELDLRREGERVLLFSLDPNLRVSQVVLADGRPLAFFQPEEPKDRFFLGNYLVVVAPDPLPPGALGIHFSYAGKRIVRKVGAGNFFCQSFGWYPTYGMGRVALTANAFAGRYDFDFTLRVPKRYEAVATGERIEEARDDKYLVTRWKSEIPLAVAGFAFGDYRIHKEARSGAQIEVHANKQPDDALRGIEIIASGDSSLSPSASPPPIALGSLSPSRLAPEMAAEVGNSLQVFEKFFGPYPYKKLAVSDIPFSYGQGWPGLLYISALSFLDSTQRQQLGLRDHVQLTDYFRAHEVSHQWWGHAVGWKSYHDQWLSEGFADYSGILYTLYRRDSKEYLRLLRDNRTQLQQKDRAGAVYEQIGPVYAGFRLSTARHPGGYGVVVYNKGGWILHMIRMMLYDPRNPQEPNHRFIAMMHDFTRTFYNQPASTEDFKAILEKHMTPGMDLDRNGRMDWFFDSWVYGTGIPQYKLDFTLTPHPSEAGKYLLKGMLRQSGVPATFRTIVPLFFHQGKNQMRVGWLNASGPETPFEIPLPFKPDNVTINEWEDILAVVK
ncbi:MAG: M1 family metallopeptidase [Candidatus Acidiferrales bacterium]